MKQRRKFITGTLYMNVANDKLTSSPSCCNLPQVFDHVKPVWLFCFRCQVTNQFLGFRFWMFERGLVQLQTLFQLNDNFVGITCLRQQRFHDLARKSERFFFISCREELDDDLILPENVSLYKNRESFVTYMKETSYSVRWVLFREKKRPSLCMAWKTAYGDLIYLHCTTLLI